MFAQVWGETTLGLTGVPVRVEVDLSSGLPAFDLVGLADAAVRESRERVRAAIRNSGFHFPGERLTINLAPADVHKDGAGLDLPVAIGILSATGELSLPEDFATTIFIGELSLDGLIRPVSGVLPMVVSAAKQGFKRVFVPWKNRPEASLVPDIECVPCHDLANAIKQLLDGVDESEDTAEEAVSPSVSVNEDDFADVAGQLLARRAVEVAAAGGHNLLMVGSPGSGKTMLARRIPSILPPLSQEEALAVTTIYSVAGELPGNTGLIRTRPFRSPHHTISSGGMIGGGSVPKPGEVTLSHHGVLFLDEMPEFSRATLEVLRQPLEDGEVRITRVKATTCYPASFMLVGAMNPCKCGFFGDADAVHPCTCSESSIMRYRARLSGPLLDRFDLKIHVSRIAYDDLRNKQAGESSAAIRDRVLTARERQTRRFQKAMTNAQMKKRDMKRFCTLDAEGEALLRQVFEQLHLSARSHDRILKVARTIADLAGSERIQAEQLAEAIQMRTDWTE